MMRLDGVTYIIRVWMDHVGKRREVLLGEGFQNLLLQILPSTNRWGFYSRTQICGGLRFGGLDAVRDSSRRLG